MYEHGPRLLIISFLTFTCPTAFSLHWVTTPHRWAGACLTNHLAISTGTLLTPASRKCLPVFVVHTTHTAALKAHWAALP